MLRQKKILLVLVILSTLMLSVHPEAVMAQGVNQEEVSALTGPRKQLATIIFSGLAGSILGLSTLSFYGRPQDHLENIAIGFAIGVMTGTAYVTWNAATAPDEFLMRDSDASMNFSRKGRAMHLSGLSNEIVIKPISYRWSF